MTIEGIDTGCAQTIAFTPSPAPDLHWTADGLVHTAIGATGIIYTIEPLNEEGTGGGRLRLSGRARPMSVACRFFGTALVSLKREAARLDRREARGQKPVW